MDPAFLAILARHAGRNCPRMSFWVPARNRTTVRNRWFEPSAGTLFEGASSSRPGAPAFADALKFDVADHAGAGRPIIWSFNARNPNPYADP
jgi:hypothetical protein